MNIMCIHPLPLYMSYNSTVKECDRFSLVTYDSDVYLKFGLIKMTQDNKARATSTVEAIIDGSSTNLCGGLLKGLLHAYVLSHSPVFRK